MECELHFKYNFAAKDGWHCPITCLAGGAESIKQYHNFKNFDSVKLLALVDAYYRFIFGVSIRATGNMHNSTYFQSTPPWGKVTKDELIPSKLQTADDIEIRA